MELFDFENATHGVEAVAETIAVLNGEVDGPTFEATDESTAYLLSFKDDDVRSSSVVTPILCDGETATVVWEHNDACANILVVGIKGQPIFRTAVFFGS